MRIQKIATLMALAIAFTAASSSVEAKKCRGNEFKRAACKAKKAAKAAAATVTQTAAAVTKPLGPVGAVIAAPITVPANALREAATLQENVVNAGSKGVSDTGAELKRAAKNANEAVIAIGHYVENQAKGAKETLSDAEKRLRQGKIADAFWHLAVDPYKHTEEAAFQAAAESSLIKTVGAVAASVYGGPQGAAAYASWLTYKQTNDVQLAIKIGLITGAANAGFKGASKIPSDELLKKTIVTAAIGGAAVAVAGGDNREVLDGFLRSGAMVLIQDGYKEMTNGDLTTDARVSNGIPYCMEALPNSAECAPPEAAYVTNPDKSLAKGPDQNNLIDIRQLDHTRQVVGQASTAEAAKGMFASINEAIVSDKGIVLKTLSVTAPGLNAGALFHDQWVMVSLMDKAQNFATIGPAIVLIYNGTAGPVNNQIQQAGVNAAKKDAAPAPQVVPASVATETKEPTQPQRTYLCAKGDIERTISIQVPTQLPELACAVSYERQRSLSLPWVAVNSNEYCFKKAEEFVAKQQEWGFACYVRDNARRTLEMAAVP